MRLEVALRSYALGTGDAMAWGITRGWGSQSQRSSYRAHAPLERPPPKAKIDRVPFSLCKPFAPAGTEIHLEAGTPPIIRSAERGDLVGEVETAIGQLLHLLLLRDTKIVGTIDSIDPRGDTGLLRVSAIPRDPASP